MKIGYDENGHRTIDGGKWHWPSHEDPTKCGERGCIHRMGTLRREPWQDEKDETPRSAPDDTEPKFRRRSRRS